MVLFGNLLWAAAGFAEPVLAVVPVFTGAVLGAGTWTPAQSSFPWEKVKDAVKKTSAAIKSTIGKPDWIKNWMEKHNAGNVQANDLRKLVWEECVFNVPRQTLRINRIIHRNLTYENNTLSIQGGDITGDGLTNLFYQTIKEMKADFDIKFKAYLKELFDMYYGEIFESLFVRPDGVPEITDEHLLEHAAKRCHRPFHYKVKVPVPNESVRDAEDSRLWQLEWATQQHRRARCDLTRIRIQAQASEMNKCRQSLKQHHLQRPDIGVELLYGKVKTEEGRKQMSLDDLMRLNECIELERRTFGR